MCAHHYGYTNLNVMFAFWLSDARWCIDIFPFCRCRHACCASNVHLLSVNPEPHGHYIRLHHDARLRCARGCLAPIHVGGLNWVILILPVCLVYVNNAIVYLKAIL